MKIKYLGHSSFLLTESTGTAIVCDPYDSAVGYNREKVRADAVTISHHHYDHDDLKGIDGKPIVLDGEHAYSLPGVEINAVKSFHDECRGKKRGENIIFKFRMDGIDICHLGDLGEECTTELLEMLLPVNVLMIPVGGTYTIDSKQAKEYVDRLMPDVVIPMHYKAKGCKLDIDRVEEFLDEFDDDEVDKIECGSEIEFLREQFDGEKTKIIVMERAQ
jgi:L-ascorbate metabolism protein UlaG (beta-lactamase superfamily)